MTEQIMPTLEGWQTEAQIGKGGFSTVYRIRREAALGLEETAALKELSIPQDENEIALLRASGMDDESIRTHYHARIQDLVREYRLMMGLKNCPNIVHCEDFQVVPKGLGYQFLLRMELLSPLSGELRKGTMNSEKAVLTLGVDICNALAVCHGKGILHRDVKPQNIFLAPDGSFKLGDFGIARTMEKNGQATSGIGTYNYMAPEVFHNQPYDFRADLYSLGLVLYQLLNGNRGPFLLPAPEALTGQDFAEARRRRFAGEPLPPPSRGSRGLQAIVEKACAFDPRRRYRSAGQMKQDLEAVLQGGEENLLAFSDAEQDLEEQALCGEPTVLAPKRRKAPRWMLGVLGGLALVVAGGLLRTPKQEPQPVAVTEPAQVLAQPVLSQDGGLYDQRITLSLTHPDPAAELYITLDHQQIQNSHNSYTILNGDSNVEFAYSPGIQLTDCRYRLPLTLYRGITQVSVYARKGDLVSEPVKAKYIIDYYPEDVSFQEPAIAEVAQNRTGKNAYSITTHDCEKVTSLYGISYAGDEGLRSLEDLYHLPMVDYLALEGEADIADYSGLRYCPNLSSLSLTDCAVSNLEWLAYTPNLTYFHLEKCGIRDFSGLAYAQKLNHLELVGEYCQLEALLADCPNLLGLRQLQIPGTQADAASLAQLTQLNTLAISYVRGMDLSALGTMTNLRSLSLCPGEYYSYPRDLKAASQAAQEAGLYQDLAFLEGLTELTSLTLDYMVFEEEELTHLYGLKSLTALSLYNCPGVNRQEAVAALEAALPDCRISYYIPE